jgi:predicted HicB family RNase H-like nuclease
MRRRKWISAMTMMHYKDYEAVVDFDEQAKIFRGKVINLYDVLTFEGVSAVDLIQAFADCVESYLARCRERGEARTGHFPANLRSTPSPAYTRR